MTMTSLPFPFQKKRAGQELIGCILVKKEGLSIYCQSCKAWVGWAKAKQKAQPNFMEMDNDGRCSHYNPDHHPFPFPEEEGSFTEEKCV